MGRARIAQAGRHTNRPATSNARHPMTTVTCTRCPIQAEIRRTGPNNVEISYDIPGMADRCIVLSGQLASGATVGIGDEPECPHLKAAVLGALNRSRR